MRTVKVTTRAVVLVLGLSLVAPLPALAGGDGGGSAKPPRTSRYLPGEFTDDTVDTVVADLARGGIGVFPLGKTRPVTRVRRPVSPVRLTVEQARTAALGAWSSSGITAAEVDTLAPVEGSVATIVPPTSALVAAYVRSAKTPGAKLARRVMRGQELEQFQGLVFPSLVLTLFVSDLASAALQDPATEVAGATGTDDLQLISSRAQAAPAPGICTKLISFVNDTIRDVFAAIPRIGVDQASIDSVLGSFLGSIVGDAARLAASVVNGFVDGAQFIVVNGVKAVTTEVLHAIADVAGVVGTVATVATTLTPWALDLRGEPTPTRRAVGTEAPIPGRFTLTVRTVGPIPDEWPRDIQDCRDAGRRAAAAAQAARRRCALDARGLCARRPDHRIRRPLVAARPGRQGRLRLRHDRRGRGDGQGGRQVRSGLGRCRPPP